MEQAEKFMCQATIRTMCCVFGYADAGSGDLAGLPVSFQNVKNL